MGDECKQHVEQIREGTYIKYTSTFKDTDPYSCNLSLSLSLSLKNSLKNNEFAKTHRSRWGAVPEFCDGCWCTPPPVTKL
jgi:hypothetical protein